MRRWQIWAIFICILVVAAALRWTGLDWDNYHHYHPDERYITWVATTIEWPADFSAALNPKLSTFNPFYWYPGAASDGIVVGQDAPRKFAYGHVPLYLGVAVTRLMEQIGPFFAAFLPQNWLLTLDLLNARQAIEFRHLTAVSRALTGLFDLGALLVVFLLGRKVYGAAVGLLAAALLAVNVMHIQLAHFFTSDPYLAFFVVTAVYFMVRSVHESQMQDAECGVGADRSRGRLKNINLILAGVFAGLAVGSKFSAVLLLIPLLTAALLGGRERWVVRLGTAVTAAVLTFVITNPFAILDFGCEVISPALNFGPLTVPAVDWKNCYLENVFTQGAMVRGDLDFGFTRQYAGTRPYLYFIEMQLRWGMGWLLGMLAFAGFGWAVWWGTRAWLKRSAPDSGYDLHGHLVLLAWSVPFFLITGSFYVKFMRYLLPLTPFLMLFGAALLGRIPGKWRYLAAGVVVGATAVYALAFVNIYNVDHPWDSASRWVYANLPAGTFIVSEQWDDALPTTMLLEGRLRRRSEYADAELTWLTGPDEQDSERKLAANLQLLSQAEYVTVLSNRVYGVVPRLPERYPLSSQYHQLLFAGELGYAPVYAATRMPNLWGFHVYPDSFVWPGLRPSPFVADYLAGFEGVNNGRFDESFTVYDQPLVMIFKNVEGKTAAEMQRLFVGGE